MDRGRLLAFLLVGPAGVALADHLGVASALADAFGGGGQRVILLAGGGGSGALGEVGVLVIG